ncbi:MAG: MFS transporter [Vicinamibacterales bacterium]
MASDEPRGRPRRILAELSVAAAAAYCSYAICRAPLLPLFARDLGAGPEIVGLVVGASTVTGIVVKLPAGALSDLLGRRRLLMAGALVFAVTPFAYMWVASLALLVLVRVVHGHATAIFSPVASAAVSDLAPAGRRGAWLSTLATAQGAGQALGPVIGGYAMAAGRFDLAFLAAGAIGVLSPALVSRLSFHASGSPRALDWAAFREGVAEVLRHRLVLATSAAHAAQFVLSGALNAFLPLYARDVVNMTPAQIGWLFAAQTLTTLAIRPLLGVVSDRVGRRHVIVAGLALCSAVVGGLPLAAGPVWLAAAVVVYAAGVATTTAATSALITDLTRRERYGAAHGVFGTIYDVGDAFGPIAAGFIVASGGYDVMFAMLATIEAGAAVAFGHVARAGRS